MKIIKISLLVSIVVNPYSLSAMHDGIEVSFRNEPSDSGEINRPSETDQQRAYRLRSQREQIHKTDFYDQEKIEADASQNDSIRQENIIGDVHNQDGDVIDVDTQREDSEKQRVKEIDKAKVDAINTFAKHMDFSAIERERNLVGKKIAGFASKMSREVNRIEKSISIKVQHYSNTIIKVDEKSRTEVKALMDQAIALSKAIDGDLAAGKKSFFGSRSKDDMNSIHEKLKDLEFVKRELYSIVGKLETEILNKIRSFEDNGATDR